jgi:hypothetical protein
MTHSKEVFNMTQARSKQVSIIKIIGCPADLFHIKIIGCPDLFLFNAIALAPQVLS